MMPKDASNREAPEAPWAADTGTDEFGAWALVRVKRVEFLMRWIPPGEFMMGSPEDEEGRWEDEGPQHRVQLTAGYWMADAPCTQELWKAVVGDDPSRFKGKHRPVEQIDFDDVVRFLEEINREHSKLRLRLATEAQWEYACRAGTAGPHYATKKKGEAAGLGNGLDEIAWYDANSGDETHDVKLLKPNDWGLYDMIGNVWEWCEDGMRDYTERDEKDPRGLIENSALSVCRGGSSFGGARGARAAFRNATFPDYRSDSLGFRLSHGPAQ